MSTVTLENQSIRVVLDPGQGMSIAACFARKTASWLPIMPDTRSTEVDLDWASFLMLPYSNRIEHGAFSFEGQHYQLAHGDNHAIHGDVRARPWHVKQIGPRHIHAVFESSAHVNVNWPWPFEARATYQLVENVISSHLALRNLGDTTMPAGLGWHPYFSRHLTQVGEPVCLRMAASSVYPDANDNRIPSGPPEQPTPQQDFTGERVLDPGNFLDTCYQGYDGGGYIAWPESGIKLCFTCSPACTHLVIYNPTGKPYFAVEPVTNANNGVNLHAQGASYSGIVPLAPGECIEAQFDLQIDAL